MDWRGECDRGIGIKGGEGWLKRLDFLMGGGCLVR